MLVPPLEAYIHSNNHGTDAGGLPRILRSTFFQNLPQAPPTKSFVLRRGLRSTVLYISNIHTCVLKCKLNMRFESPRCACNWKVQVSYASAFISIKNIQQKVCYKKSRPTPLNNKRMVVLVMLIAMAALDMFVVIAETTMKGRWTACVERRLNRVERHDMPRLPGKKIKPFWLKILEE